MCVNDRFFSKENTKDAAWRLSCLGSFNEKQTKRHVQICSSATSSSVLPSGLKSGEELNDGVEEFFDLIVILLQELKISIVVGQFVDEIFHDCVLLNSRLFFALFMLVYIIPLIFHLSTLFS